MASVPFTIADYRRILDQEKASASVLVSQARERALRYQPHLNAFVTLLDTPEISRQAAGPLAGIPYALKDNFSTKGILSTGSSNILRDYIPVFDATVVERLRDAGAVLIGKTVLDELAMGGTGMTGHTGLVHNPWNHERMTGGSSAGSAAAVCAGIVPFALGSDTGDSVRKPAAYCGIVGFKPSWGRISRFGLFPFAPSLDHVGVFARCVRDAAIVTEVLAGSDARDMTCSTRPVPAFGTELHPSVKGARIAVLQPVIDSLIREEVRNHFDDVVQRAKQAGATVDYIPFDVDLLKALYSVYMVISCAEATSNNANLDGIKFGPRGEGDTFEQMMIATRTQGFGELIKRRFVLGSYCLARENQDRLFLRAQKIRQRVVRRLNEVYQQYDAILLPAAGDVAPRFDKEAKDEKLSNHYLIAENHLVLGNFSGCPSITIPSGMLDGMPLGINLMTQAYTDQKTLDLAAGMEALLDFVPFTYEGGDGQ